MQVMGERIIGTITEFRVGMSYITRAQQGSFITTVGLRYILCSSRGLHRDCCRDLLLHSLLGAGSVEVS